MTTATVARCWWLPRPRSGRWWLTRGWSSVVAIGYAIIGFAYLNIAGASDARIVTEASFLAAAVSLGALAAFPEQIAVRSVAAGVGAFAPALRAFSLVFDSHDPTGPLLLNQSIVVYVTVWLVLAFVVGFTTATTGQYAMRR